MLHELLSFTYVTNVPQFCLVGGGAEPSEVGAFFHATRNAAQQAVAQALSASDASPNHLVWLPVWLYRDEEEDGLDAVDIYEVRVFSLA